MLHAQGLVYIRACLHSVELLYFLCPLLGTQHPCHQRELLGKSLDDPIKEETAPAVADEDYTHSKPAFSRDEFMKLL
jgi:hypothetical protein